VPRMDDDLRDSEIYRVTVELLVGAIAIAVVDFSWLSLAEKLLKRGALLRCSSIAGACESDDHLASLCERQQ
jgi:hypothetical protein